MGGGMLISTGTIYVLFSKSELQPWNSPQIPDIKNALESELKALKKEEDMYDKGETNNTKQNVISDASTDTNKKK